MLFGRRKPTALGERIRISLWPRRSWSRSLKYVFHRLHRLRSTPHAIALGCACGVLVSFTPFLGFHFVIAGLLSWFSRASIIASALGTFMGNPITFPFIWMGAYKLGTYTLAKEPVHEVVLMEPSLSGNFLLTSVEQLWSLVLPLTVGGIPLGFITAMICYFPVKRAVEVYQLRRDHLRVGNCQSDAGGV